MIAYEFDYDLTNWSIYLRIQGFLKTNEQTLLSFYIYTSQSTAISPLKHFRGRKRNCYSIAIRYVHRALVYATKGRKLRKMDIADVSLRVPSSASFINSTTLQLRDGRITAACEQHDISFRTFKEGLLRSKVMLDRNVLADLACWEPYSFKALTQVAKDRAASDGINLTDDFRLSSRIITRGMRK